MRTALRYVVVAMASLSLLTAAGAADVLIKDPGYKVLAHLRPDGTLAQESGQVLGHLQHDGAILDAERHLLGRVTKNGFVKDADGKTLGRIREDGTVLGADGAILGYIAKSGLVQAADLDTAAHVEGAGWDPVEMAAFWFFFRESIFPKAAPAPPPGPAGEKKAPAAKQGP